MNKELVKAIAKQLTDNAFCATGPGGGVDPSCGKESGGGKPTKDPATMKASEINKALDKIDKEASKLTDQMIAEGRGHERPSEYLAKTDPLSSALRDNFERRSRLRSEIERRYGPGAPSRLPPKFGPIKPT